MCSIRADVLCLSDKGLFTDFQERRRERVQPTIFDSVLVLSFALLPPGYTYSLQDGDGLLGFLCN